MTTVTTRIRKALALCAGAFSCWAPLTATAASVPISLPRDGKWVMDYDTDACRLVAAHGTGNDAVVFILHRFQPTGGFYLDLIGKRFDLDQPAAKVTLDFGPEENPRTFMPMLGTSNDRPAILGLHDDLLDRSTENDGETLAAVTPEQETAVTYLVVRQGAHKPIRLELGSMGAPMRAMRTCTTDLVRSWGFDPAVQDTLSRTPKSIGSPGNWLHSSDYPTNMLMVGGQGLVQFRLDVDEQGAVTGCHIQGHTKPEGFTDLTCRLIAKRAKFQPALDSAGRPVKSFYVNRVRWIL